ncbi:hypothetical protein [Streptomyces lasiicapitis]|uniref:hypothetical protein n=1 Tax=Streptomyces lasiicapitis TaxID=1923961 RepID=UPI003665F6FB
MADIYELWIALDLRDELSEAEIAELQWHLGLGPQPGSLGIVREFPVVVEDDDGEPVVEDVPEPLLAQQGEAAKVGGALTAALARRGSRGGGGWAVTARQEVHPDGWERLGELLVWLAAKSVPQQRQFDGSVGVGWIRFYEEERPERVRVLGGEALWPEAVDVTG